MFLAENLDERNVGQVLVYEDGSKMGIIHEIEIDHDHGRTIVHTIDSVVEYNFGEVVHARLSQELRMARIILNAIVGLEDAELRLSDEDN